MEIMSVDNAIKVGDTISDIKEGKNAGLIAIGIVEGSSIMGLTEEEYENLSVDKKAEEVNRVKKIYKEAGADYIIMNMSNLIGTIEEIEKSNN